MVYKCCVFQCNNERDKDKGISMHVFPDKTRFPVLHKQWLKKIKRKNFVPTKYTRVCSIHFSDDDFELSSRLKAELLDSKMIAILKPNAVPSKQLTGKGEKSVIIRHSNYLKQRRVQDAIEGLQEPQPSTSGAVGKSKKLKRSSNSNDLDSESVFLDVSQCLEITHSSCEIDVQCELGTETYRSVNKNVSDSEHETRQDDLHDQPYTPGDDFDELESIEDSDNDYESDGDGDINENNKNGNQFPNVFFVFWHCLLQLFRFCQFCGKPVVDLTNSIHGAILVVTTTCIDNHVRVWMSQPKVGRIHAGSVNIAAAIYTCGISFTSFQRFAQALKLNVMSKTSFYSIIKKHVRPVIINVWQNQRDDEFARIKSLSDETWVCGDGQFDSPGFCAKFITYTIMDIRSGRILDFIVMQKGQITTELEKAACETILKKLRDTIQIKLFLSDRHRGVGLLMRTIFPSIHHEFDVWHLAKSLAKKIKACTKKNSLLSEWKSSITNHLWWCAESCGGNPDILVEKFISILKHISNIHTWQGNEHFHQCEHELETDGSERKSLKWLQPGSQDYQALTKIVLDKTFLKDLKHTSNYCHTGALESFHNLRLKYLPKRSHFPYDGMVLRGILAILDHNANVGRDCKTEYLRYSKAQKDWLLVNTYEASRTTWRSQLIDKIMELNTTYDDIDEYKGVVPQNIAPIPKPSIEEVKLRARYSRFSQY